MSAVLEAIRPIEDYLVMPDAEIAESIEEARKELGEKVDYFRSSLSAR